MSEFGKLIDKITDIALGYTAVALVGAQAFVKSIMPSKPKVIAPTIVERLPAQAPLKAKEVEFVEAVLVDPKEAAQLDKSFEALQKESYPGFQKRYDELSSKLKDDVAEEKVKKSNTVVRPANKSPKNS